MPSRRSRWILVLIALFPCTLAAQVSVVIPIVNCVQYDPATKVLTVHFGYINTGTNPRFVSRGGNNLVDPEPSIREDQPTNFFPGRHDNVWQTTQLLDGTHTITNPDGSTSVVPITGVDWVLFGIPAHASDDPLLYCTNPPCTAVPGPAGPTGAAGATGPQGPQGLTGPKGDTGPAGLQGPSGPQGPTGASGATGPAGPTGATGPQGPQGPQGPPGPQGPQGAKGDTGIAGPQGPQGLAGPAGPQGAQGPQGDAGVTGPQGPAGPQGAKGDPGPQGIQGPTGPAGPPGDRGPQGFRGVQGIAGPPGPAGPRGYDGRAVSRSVQASDAITVNPGGSRVLELQVTVDEPLTLLVIGAVSTRSAGESRVEVLIDGAPAGMAFRTNAPDAVVPVPVQVKTSMAPGSHSVALRVDGAGPVSVSERSLTVLAYREGL